jgi:hypothetical protein
MTTNLQQVVADFADCLVGIDRESARFKAFQPGVGPFGEPQLVKLVASRLNLLPQYSGLVVTKRTPDLLIKQQWAIEVKIARPFGDNGREAESWSVNLLHPYAGNISLIGDCMKLKSYADVERRAVLVVGYEHCPPQISLTPLLHAFEVIAKHVSEIELGPRCEAKRDSLIHPVHQQVRIVAWEVSA